MRPVPRLLALLGFAAIGLGPALAPDARAQFDGPMDGGGGRMGYGHPRGDPEEAGRHRYLSYHGFRIDVGGLDGLVNTDSEVAAVEQQIDMVEGSGVSPSALATFRSVPIRVTAGFVGGSHYRGGREVTLQGVAGGEARPVLLHEYMHVYEFKRMPGGFHNATVIGFFRDAQERGLYEQGSYMMSNASEFFAMTASCYLHGTVARAPYTREAIRESQPEYYAYLARLFGGGASAALR